MASKQLCTWVWDDWDDRDSKGIWEIHNCPLKGIGVRDFYAFFDFFLLAGRFSIGCGSEFREILAYLEVGRLDLEQIHEKNYFHQISDIFMKSRIYSWVNFKKSNHAPPALHALQAGGA